MTSIKATDARAKLYYRVRSSILGSGVFGV